MKKSRLAVLLILMGMAGPGSVGLLSANEAVVVPAAPVCLNGVKVNGGTGSSLREGKSLFQSEGAEIFYPGIVLHPLSKPAAAAGVKPPRAAGARLGIP